MLTKIKHAFRRLSPQELALHELTNAELELLEARSAVEYAQAITTYNEARVERLRLYLQQTKR
jgi:hypothetical protein